MASTLRIGSRPSALALVQSNLIRNRLESMLPGFRVEILPISTTGDKMATASLARIGGKGLFVRELEQALADGRIDIAVHSMKDLPAIIPSRFRIAAVPRRENPRDALIMRTGGGWGDLCLGARLGTSSARRRLEALRIRPDLNVLPLRGNVDTRLRRLEAGEFDAIILAVAGLRRLGRAEAINFFELDDRIFVPSGGQGALALEALNGVAIGGSAQLDRAVSAVNDVASLAEISAERGFLAAIGASCASPVGVKGSVDRDSLHLRALLFSVDGSDSLADEISAPYQLDTASNVDTNRDAIARATALGAELGRRMLARGAGELIGNG